MKQEYPFEKVSSWIKNSVMLKLVIITVLMLLLLIPTSMIKSIIRERESLNNETINEVSSKWAEKQEIAGPILSVPTVYEYVDTNGNITTETKLWHVLPKRLDIDGNITPESLKRGIYEVVVYEGKIAIKGDFDFETLDSANLKEIRFDHAFLTIGISDLRGIKNQIKVKWKGRLIDVKPGTKIPNILYSGVTLELPDISGLQQNPISFDFTLDIQGSQNISFAPLGSTTNVSLKSTWKSPSFNGSFLPDSRNITSDGFTAEWKVLQLNRNYPQSWVGNLKVKNPTAANQPAIYGYNSGSSIFSNSAFGVELILPLDDYQKSMRSAKYAVMTISLTFLIFFLVEIINKRKIHPFQYALVGLALCLFYILLVAISEHLNFNISYGISSIGIVTMITMYSLTIFKMKKLTYLLSFILIGIYGFLFVTLQLSDFALLMGSIGLIVILALTMYFTRNINWYKLNIEIE